MDGIEVKAGKVAPELAAAIVAAQRQAQTIKRDGKGQHGAYTSSDEIAAVARELLTANGLAWVRVGVGLHEPMLMTCELGNQAYVGDLVEHWVLVHESGGTLQAAGSRMPIVASKGRPHDKALGASLTYDAGAVLRGLLCLDREDRNTAIDQRHDHDDRAPQPEPRRAKNRLEQFQDTVAAKIDALAVAESTDRGQVWAKICAAAGYPSPLGSGRGPYGCQAEDLRRVVDAIKSMGSPKPAEEAQP